MNNKKQASNARQAAQHYSPNSFTRQWDRRIGPILISALEVFLNVMRYINPRFTYFYLGPQRWGGYIGPADATRHKARQGKKQASTVRS